MLWLSRLDRVDLAGRGKVFYGEKLAWLGGWPYHHKRMNLARSATPSAESTSCFVSKRFARIVRKWKVGSPRVALAGGWPFCLGQLFNWAACGRSSQSEGRHEAWDQETMFSQARRSGSMDSWLSVLVNFSFSYKIHYSCLVKAAKWIRLTAGLVYNCT